MLFCFAGLRARSPGNCHPDTGRSALDRRVAAVVLKKSSRKRREHAGNMAAAHRPQRVGLQFLHRACED